MGSKRGLKRGPKGVQKGSKMVILRTSKLDPFLHFLRSRYQRAYQKRTSQIGRVHLRDHKMGVLDTPYMVQDPPGDLL